MIELVRAGVLSLLSCALVGGLPAQQPQPGDRQIVVSVKDADGRATRGVPIVLGHLRSIGDEQDFSRLDRGATALTDAAGRAVLTIPAGTEITQLHAQALVLAEPPVRLSLAAMPAEAALQLPPCGQVRVLVYDDQEHPRSGIAGIALRMVGNRRFFDHLDVPGEPEAEGAQFHHVALGLQLEARAALAGVNGALVARRAGPTRVGELVVIDLREQEGMQVSCRLLGLDGRPVAAARLGFVVRWDRNCQVTEVETGADGTFRYQVPDALASRADVALTLVRRGAEGRGYLGSLAIPVGEPWRGERDLGDLALQQEPSLVRGRVLDPQGRPVAGLAITAPLAVTMGVTGLEVRTRRAPRHDVVTDTDGRFEFFELAGPPVALPVEVHGDWLLPPTTIATGGAPIDIAVLAPSKLRLQLTGVPEGVVVPGVRLLQQEQMRANGPGMILPADTRTTQAGGVLEFTGLLPGTYDLELGAALGWGPFRLRDLAITPGVDCADARLQCKDWSSSLQLVSLRIIGPAGEPVAASVSIYEVAAHGFSGVGVPMRVGQPLPVLLAKGRRLVVEAADSCTEVITDPPAQLEVRLRPRPRVRLAIARGELWPAGLRVQLGSPDSDFLGSARVEVSTSGEAQLSMQPRRIGKVAVTISAPVGDGSWRPAWNGEIDVAASADEQLVELPITPEQLAALRSPAPQKRSQ
jgi:hypothetical protein